jgi:copper chaperone CopZ
MKKQTIYITGTHCPACKKLIEKRIMSIAGVESVDVNFTSGETKIIGDKEITKAEIKNVLEGTDYAQKD